MTAVTCRLQRLDPAADPATATRLLEIQRAAYLVEAALIGDDRIPALHEAVGDVQLLPVSWLGAYADDELVGAVAWTASDHGARPAGVDIDRLVVDPELARRGIGRTLVLAVLELAAGREVTVSTGRGNLPAANLYRGLGFLPAGDIEAIPTLWVSQFVRPAG